MHLSICLDHNLHQKWRLPENYSAPNPKNVFFRSIESTCNSKNFAAKIFEFAWILDFLCLLKVALEVLHDQVLGSLGRRLLMTSTQEPNTMAPQSALCSWSRKWKAKLVVPIYFGTKTSEIWLRIISCSSLESELGFNSKDSEKTSRSTTVKSLLGALRALCNISSADREDLFGNELLVY